MIFIIVRQISSIMLAVIIRWTARKVINARQRVQPKMRMSRTLTIHNRKINSAMPAFEGRARTRSVRADLHWGPTYDKQWLFNPMSLPCDE